MEHQIISTWAQVIVTLGIGLGQIGLIAYGLRQMSKVSEVRNRQLDIMEAAQRRQGDALERQGEVLAELLRRTA